MCPGQGGTSDVGLDLALSVALFVWEVELAPRAVPLFLAALALGTDARDIRTRKRDEMVLGWLGGSLRSVWKWRQAPVVPLAWPLA
jgi:hypothetical protein